MRWGKAAFYTWFVLVVVGTAWLVLVWLVDPLGAVIAYAALILMLLYPIAYKAARDMVREDEREGGGGG